MTEIEKTIEEKIEYIYTTLRKQEKNNRIAFFFKWGFRIFMLAYLYYFFMISLPNTIKSLVPSMPEMNMGNFSDRIPEGKMQELYDLYFSE